MERLFTEQEVAAILGVKPKTLRNWRSLDQQLPPAERQGPSWTKVGHLVRYCPADVRQYVEHRRM